MTWRTGTLLTETAELSSGFIGFVFAGFYAEKSMQEFARICANFSILAGFYADMRHILYFFSQFACNISPILQDNVRNLLVILQELLRQLSESQRSVSCLFAGCGVN